MPEKEQKEERRFSDWVRHMMSFVDQQVEVTYYLAGEARKLEGHLRYFNFNKDSLLIETKEEIIWVRTPITVKRSL